MFLLIFLTANSLGRTHQLKEKGPVGFLSSAQAKGNRKVFKQRLSCSNVISVNR